MIYLITPLLLDNFCLTSNEAVTAMEQVKIINQFCVLMYLFR